MEKKLYTYDEINSLVTSYKNTGRKAYLAKLLKIFEGYIVKYTNFLKFGTFKRTDKDLIMLINMVEHSSSTPRIIQKIFESYTYDDIFNEISIMFIKAVNAFKQKENGPGFTGYIYCYLKFMVKKKIKEISSDILNTLKVNFDTEYEFSDEVLENYESKIKNICFFDDEILNKFEKYILYLSYGKKISAREISKLLYTSRNKINNIKLISKNKLLNSGITINDFITD